MKVEILSAAKQDPVDGYWFDERQHSSLGDYFLKQLKSDIDTLALYAGIHRRAYGRYHWLGSKRFPYAILYYVKDDTAFVDAVIPCRRSEKWISRRLDL